MLNTNRSQTIAIVDQSSKWNLDIETGQIEQDVLGTPASSSSSSSAGSNKKKKGEKGNRSKRCCCSVHDVMHRIEQAGGDLPARLGAALRASMGSGIFFSALVFTNPKYLGAIWIGNIFFHSALQGNVGEAVEAASGFTKSIFLTTLLSWPISFAFGQTTEHVAQICLPILTVVLSLVIMTCPWLTSPNLMILVMYVIIAAPVRFPSTTWWEPLGYMGSYLIGLGMAVFMNLIPLFPPTFRPNTATRQVHVLMDRLSKDFFLLFVQSRYYTYSNGRSPKVARAAGAAIEVLVGRMTNAIQELKRLLPAVNIELWWLQWGLSSDPSVPTVEHLARWIQFLEGIVTDMKMLRCALNSRFLGEQENEYADKRTISTGHIRQVISMELGQDYHQFIDSLIHLSVACNRQADPTSPPCLHSPSAAAVPNGPRAMVLDNSQLSNSLNLTRAAFGRALHRVTKEVQAARSSNDLHTTIPIFAHLARRSTSMNSLLSIAASLLEYSTTINNEDKFNNKVGAADANEDHEDLFPTPTLMGWCCNNIRGLGNSFLDAWWQPKWFWRDPQKRRLALKTAVGMMFASLWIAVPQMWAVSQPFGLWPGLTVASVNLATTGSSFHKAIDRLVGTLFAAAYALLVVEFFSGDQDTAKIPAIALFTFAVIYLKKDDHAYQYSYAATSIGSMMYGSVKNSYDVKGYIPQRILLIFVGVITFSLVELLLFPRSSQRVVEAKLLKYFDLLGAFFKKARDFSHIMQRDTASPEEDREENGSLSDANTFMSLGESRRLMEPEANHFFQELLAAEGALRSNSLTLKTELGSALLEPYFGFSQKLHAQSINGMVSEIGESETQALLLVKALKMVAQYTEHSEASRAGGIALKGWPSAYASFLDRAGKQMDIVCQDLSAAYPDGFFRPQNGNTLRAITAAAAFRDFRDVRLSIITSWSEEFQESAGNESLLDPNELIVMGITTSFILELCRHLQLAGRNMEWAAAHFPTFQ